MSRITRVAPHLSAEEVKTRLHQDPRPLRRQRWLIIYNALVDPREASEIAKHTGPPWPWCTESLPATIAWGSLPSRQSAKEADVANR